MQVFGEKVSSKPMSLKNLIVLRILCALFLFLCKNIGTYTINKINMAVVEIADTVIMISLVVENFGKYIYIIFDIANGRLTWIRILKKEFHLILLRALFT